MPTPFGIHSRANNQILRKLQTRVNNLTGLSYIESGVRRWTNLRPGNRHRLHHLNTRKKKNPSAKEFNVDHLTKLLRLLTQQVKSRQFMYGYIPRSAHPTRVHPSSVATFVREGSIKPITYGPPRRPSPKRPPPRHVPTLKEMAWNASGLKGMTPAQLSAASMFSPYNLTQLRPKVAAALSPSALANIRRNLAARVIQKAVRKKYVRKE